MNGNGGTPANTHVDRDRQGYKGGETEENHYGSSEKDMGAE